MKGKIIEYCRQIEEEENVTILFAIESGSRLWGFSSKDSDYDVRFVFIQPLEKYISIDAKVSEKVISRTFEGKLIDMSGFDIIKFCRLLQKSNPSVIEWLQSDIIYYGEKPKRLMGLVFSEFSPKSLFYHYRSMCQQNYEKYILSGNLVTYKKYLYSMRGLLNAQIVQHTHTIPPIKFGDALDTYPHLLPQHIVRKLKEIINIKKTGEEKNIIPHHQVFDSFIEHFLQEEGNDTPQKLIAPEKINKEV